VGAFRYRGGMVRFAVYEDFIVISAMKAYLLQASDLKKVTAGKEMLVATVDIEHNRADVPTSIRIHAPMTDAVKSWIARHNLG